MVVFFVVIEFMRTESGMSELIENIIWLLWGWMWILVISQSGITSIFTESEDSSSNSARSRPLNLFSKRPLISLLRRLFPMLRLDLRPLAVQ